jgi:YVTN family beta-propeller protein
MSVRVSLTGRVSIEARGVVIDEQRFPGRQGRLVFAYLLAQARPVPRAELADALWGDAPPATWEKALSVLVSKLRTLLNDCELDGSQSLTSAFGCYQLTLPSGTWIDVVAADEAVSSAELALAGGDANQARTDAATAESLARRTFLPGEDARWAEEKRVELRETLVRALDCLAESHRTAGDPRAAVRAAEELVELEPYRERGYRLLMEAQSAAGNDAEALRTYERCRRLLADELGAYPSAETEAIYRRLLDAPTAQAMSAGETDASITRASAETQRRTESQLRIDALPSDVAPLSTLDVDGRRARRRTFVIVALVSAIVATAVLLVAVARRGGREANVPPNSVAAIDARSNQLVGAVAVGVGPKAVTAGGGSVWIANTADETVSRIDARTRQLIRTIAVGEYPSDLVFARGETWVALGGLNQVRRITPSSNLAEEAYEVPALASARCLRSETSLTASPGALWLTCDIGGSSNAFRIVSSTGATATVDDALNSSLPTGVLFSDLASGLGAVWFVNAAGNTVAQIEPVTLRKVREEGVGTNPRAAAVGFGSVWVANYTDDSVSRLKLGELVSPAGVDTIGVGDGPVDIAVGRTAVWVVNQIDQSVARIDPRTNEVVATIGLRQEPQRVAATADTIWVTVRELSKR